MHTIHVECLQCDYELVRTMLDVIEACEPIMLDAMTMLDMNLLLCVWMNANVCIAYGLNAGLV